MLAKIDEKVLTQHQLFFVLKLLRQQYIHSNSAKKDDKLLRIFIRAVTLWKWFRGSVLDLVQSFFRWAALIHSKEVQHLHRFWTVFINHCQGLHCHKNILQNYYSICSRNILNQTRDLIEALTFKVLICCSNFIKRS